MKDQRAEADAKKALPEAARMSLFRRIPWLRRPLRGQTMVELAMVLPLCCLLIFGTVDFARMFFLQMNVEEAVQEAGRFASTGNHLSDPKNPGNNLSRVQSIVAMIQQKAGASNAPTSNIQISSLSGGVWTTGSAGGPGDTVLVSVNANVSLLTPMLGHLFSGGKYTFTASTTFKNEPFPPGNAT